MSETENAACAHTIVRWTTARNEDGTTSGWWQCRDCGTKFWPIIPDPLTSEFAEEICARGLVSDSRGYQCLYCDGTSNLGRDLTHASTCIVGKAQAYLKEHKP